MAKLTMVSNRINDVQERNLKMYPFIFFDGVTSARIDYDFSVTPLVSAEEDKKNLDIQYNLRAETNNFKVIYYLDIDQNKGNNDLDKRFQALHASINTLFWNGILVEVYFNNNMVYTSKKHV